MSVYYNENDPAAAHVLRCLSAEDVIVSGIVDDRSIKEIDPNDLEGHNQCHFFAGGGLWSVAARLAGWPDDSPIWTASCPCQPYSPAGKGLGEDDPRHLWPDLFRLVRARRPRVIVGEQVGGKAGVAWLDGVRADMEGIGYALWFVEAPACAVDAPNQRIRIWWVAVANADRQRQPRRPQQNERPIEPEQQTSRRDDTSRCDMARNRSYWSDAEWIECHDGKARRAPRSKSSLRNVAYGVCGELHARGHSGAEGEAEEVIDYRLLVPPFLGRVDAWRITGNAIVPELAAEVLGALMDVLDDEI